MKRDIAVDAGGIHIRAWKSGDYLPLNVLSVSGQYR